MQPNPRLFHLLHRVHQSLFRVSDKILGQELGISTSQSAVLFYLKRRGGASMGDLAAAVGLKITSASGLIDRMEKKGLVSRRRSAADRRAVEVALTQSGRNMLLRAEPLVAASNAELAVKIGAVADVAAFASACESIISASEELYARTVSEPAEDQNPEIKQSL